MDRDRLDAATALFLAAARLFSRLDAARPAAACLPELGLALHASGDLLSAAHALRRALRLLGDPAFTPSLAARLHLALAEIIATLERSRATHDHREHAHRLYHLSPSHPSTSSAPGAEPLFDRARQALLARGSLAEAASRGPTRHSSPPSTGVVGL